MTFKHTKYTKEIFRFFEEESDNGFIVAVAGAGKSTNLIEMLKYFNANPYKFPIHIRRGLFLFVAFSKAIKEEISGLIPWGLRKEWERRVHKSIDNLSANAEMDEIMGRNFLPTIAINEIVTAIYFWQTRYPEGTCEEAEMLEDMLNCIDDGEWEILLQLSSRFMKILPDIDVKTFHGLGHLILSNHFEKANMNIVLEENKYSNISRQAIKDSDKKYSKDDYKLVFSTLKKLEGLCRLNFTDVNDPKEVRDIAINYDVDIGQKYPRLMVDVIRLIPDVINEGVKIASNTGVIDYTDMIYLPIKWDLNPDHPYDFIFVDEAQDLSSITRALTYEKSLVDKGRAFFVGDPAQSIMQFAGSEIDSVNLTILHTNAKELPLNVCYRCPKSHLELAKKLVPQIEPRENAPEGTLLCADPSQLPALVRGGDMVLCRYNAPLIAMATLLLSMSIPARVKGKDIHSSIINTVRQIEADVIKKDGYFDFEKLSEYVEDWATERVTYLMGMDANEGVIGNVYDTRDSILAAYNGMTAKDLNQFVLGINTLFGSDQKSVMFTTVHSAKGLGRDRVFILSPSAMPSERIGQSEWQYQQELNILYVALTRSKDFLCILGLENVWDNIIGRISPTDKVENYLVGGRRLLNSKQKDDYKKNLYGSPLHNPMPSLPIGDLLDENEDEDENQYEVVQLNDGTKLRINLRTGESEVVL